jgi:hypothetical protein
MSITLNDDKKSTISKVGEINLIKLYKSRRNGKYRFSCEWRNSTSKKYFDYVKASDRDEDYDNVIIEREFFWKRERALVNFFLNII